MVYQQLINWLMPEYYERMPQDLKGEFITATAMAAPEFGYSIWPHIYKKQFNDIRKAYRYVRIMALCRDLFTKLSYPDYGVKYFIVDKDKRELYNI